MPNSKKVLVFLDGLQEILIFREMLGYMLRFVPELRVEISGVVCSNFQLFDIVMEGIDINIVKFYPDLELKHTSMLLKEHEADLALYLGNDHFFGGTDPSKIMVVKFGEKIGCSFKDFAFESVIEAGYPEIYFSILFPIDPEGIINEIPFAIHKDDTSVSLAKRMRGQAALAIAKALALVANDYVALYFHNNKWKVRHADHAPKRMFKKEKIEEGMKK